MGWTPNFPNMTSNNPFDKLSPAEQDEYRRRFPRAGFWVGALPPPPDLAPYYRPHVARVEQSTPLMGPGVPPPPPYHQLTPAVYHREPVVAASAMRAPVFPARMLSFLNKTIYLSLISEPRYSTHH
jgi:hypothetical protein